MTQTLSQLSAFARRGFWALKIGVAAGLLLLVGALVAGAVPTLFGYESYVVMSGSMEPALQVGDLAVVGAVRPEDLRVRDIISYRTPARPNVVVTHRLVGVGTNAAGRLTFETRGDANDSSDQVDVDGDAVLGRVMYAVPRVGYLVDFAKRPLGKVVLLGLPGLLLVLDALFSKRAPRTTPAAQPAPAAPLPADERPAHQPTPRPQPTPATAEALVRRAWVAQRNGRLGEALELLDRAIPLDPSSEAAWLLKAECLQSPAARLTCLWEGLEAIPTSAALRSASSEAAALLTAAPELSLDAPPTPAAPRYARATH